MYRVMFAVIRLILTVIIGTVWVCFVLLGTSDVDI